MLRTLRWGLLSTARINASLIPALHSSKRSHVVAVASRSQEKAAIYAKEWEIPRAYSCYEALLADPDIEIIYNSLPNSMHAEWTIRSVEAGKHVLCEKPLALSMAEVDDIRDAAARTGRVVAEGFMYRHHAQTRLVYKMVVDGLLGTIKLVRGCFSYNYTRKGSFHFDPELGGGSLWDIGCYPVSYSRYVLGEEPQEVFGWQVTSSTGVDEIYCGQMRFPGGGLVQFDCGFRMARRSFIEIVGDQAALTVQSPYKPGSAEVLLLTSRDDKVQELAVTGQDPYIGEIQDMEDAVLLAKEPAVSLLDSRGNVAAITALLASARLGQPVYIGER
jgi:D-xylose 1-dehydrogenase (NADP+, D-xylono-1,5-lactone-forming)